MPWRVRWWQFVHNALVHPLEGLIVLATGRCPVWIDTLHDWSSEKAWGRQTLLPFSEVGKGKP